MHGHPAWPALFPRERFAAEGVAVDLKILPLAITMMAGPQIMAAIILVTTQQPVRVSLAFLVGVLVGVTAGIAITRGIFTLIGGDKLNKPSGSGLVGNIIQYVLIGLLIVAALRNYIKRATIKPPKWLDTLMRADARRAFTTGLLVILLMPSDIAVMLTVGSHLVQHHVGFGGALPFIGLTVLIAALPLLVLVLFHNRAQRAMPGVRTWMTSHSWLINIVCCLIFIALIH
jgi:threonine/homoserine/homoserine lactone efflux protein